MITSVIPFGRFLRELLLSFSLYNGTRESPSSYFPVDSSYVELLIQQKKALQGISDVFVCFLLFQFFAEMIGDFAIAFGSVV